MPEDSPPAAPKGIQIGFMTGGIIILVAVSGYFVGLRQTNSAIAMTRAVEVVREETHRDLTGASAVPVAVSYRDQDWSEHGPNGLWRNSLIDFQQQPADAPDAARPVSPEAKLAALHARAHSRAFDGAPPTVPHPIAQDSSAACLACHGRGLQVKDRFASKISHPTYGGSCTQCHVATAGAFTAAEAATLGAPLAENSFQGREAPPNAPRAWPGAPPVIPHATLVRSDCMSCHGPNGLFALRTPHPDRQSCTQCHVSAAASDQRQFVPSPPLDAPRPAETPKPAPQPAESAPLPTESPEP
jgi:cytochrome c-type protein NapB